MRCFRWATIALGAIAAPILFLVALRLWAEDDLERVTFDPSPLIAMPTEREIREVQRTNVRLESDHPAALRAPHWVGDTTVHQLRIEVAIAPLVRYLPRRPQVILRR